MPVTIRCDAVLFDMDGTLIDSTVACDRLVRTWATRHGLDPEFISVAAHGRRNRDIVREFTPHLPLDEEAAQLDAEELLFREGNVAIAGAAQLLSALPMTSWAVVTSASWRVAEMRFECTGLPLPAVLISSKDVRQGKPDPEGYLSAATQLGVAPKNCLVVEDTPAGLEAARNAGMQVLAITTTFSPAELNGATCIADFTAIQLANTSAPSGLRLELNIQSATC